MRLVIPEGKQAVGRIRSFFTRQDAIALLAAFAIGLLTHMYMLTNKLPNFDDIYCNYSDNRMAFMGRWFLFIPSAISSSLSLPWVNGMISMLALSGVCMMIVKLFDVKRTFCVLLISAVVMTFPVVSDTLMYMFTADGYFIGLLLGVVGVYLTDRYKWGFLPGGVLMALSLGCYQAYIFFCVGLIGMRGILYLIDPKTDTRAVLSKAWRFVAALAIAAVLWLAVCKIWTLITGRALGGQQGRSQFGIETILLLPRSVWKVYAEYWHLITERGEVYFTLYQRALFLLSNVANVGMIFLSMLYARKKSWLQTGLTVALVLLTPLLFNGIYLINTEFIYSLMQYSQCLPLVFTLVLYDVFSRRTAAAKWFWKRSLTLTAGYLMAVTFFALSVHQAVHSNQKYVLVGMKHDNCFALCNRIVDRIEQLPEFTGDNMVWIEGSADHSNPSYEKLKHSEIPLFGNTFATGYYRSYAMLYDTYEYIAFIRDYIGVVYPWPDADMAKEALATEEFAQMPYFPATGSVRCINDVIVVRLGPSGYEPLYDQ